MSVKGMSAAISIGAITAVCKTLDAYDIDGKVTLKRHVGGDLVVTGEEAKKIIIAVLSQVAGEIAEIADEEETF